MYKFVDSVILTRYYFYSSSKTCLTASHNDCCSTEATARSLHYHIPYHKFIYSAYFMYTNSFANLIRHKDIQT